MIGKSSTSCWLLWSGVDVDVVLQELAWSSPPLCNAAATQKSLELDVVVGIVASYLPGIKSELQTYKKSLIWYDRYNSNPRLVSVFKIHHDPPAKISSASSDSTLTPAACCLLAVFSLASCDWSPLGSQPANDCFCRNKKQQATSTQRSQ